MNIVKVTIRELINEVKSLEKTSSKDLGDVERGEAESEVARVLQYSRAQMLMKDLPRPDLDKI